MQARHDVLFQRGPFVVRVVRTESMSLRHFKRHAGSLSIVPLDKAYMVEAMTRAARWEKWDGRAEDWRKTNAPEQVAQTYLARSGHWRLPRLLSVIGAPTLRPDGSILQTPGYDAEMAAWFDPGEQKFPRIPEKPTQRQAMAALEMLVESSDTLPFVGPSDQSVMLSLMLTALVRRSLPSAPLGAITAPTPRSGKTLIAECIGIMLTGVQPAAMTYPSSDEEAEKTALTLLMCGDPIVLIDNIERPLQGAWLCSILTGETYQGRMLGRNEMLNAPTNTLWLATGNKLVIQGDLRSRALLCRIDPKQERPEHRQFKERLQDVFARKRSELVAAGLTIIRAYLVGGEKAGVFRPWGGFERWSQMCREPLMWLGLTDPCESYQHIAEIDPERQEHRQLIAAWKQTFGDQEASARQAINQCVLDSNDALRDVLADIAMDRGGTLSAKRLGKWLNKHCERIVDGRFIEKSSEIKGVSMFRIRDAKV